MKSFYVLLARIILSLAIAYGISMFFFDAISHIKIWALAGGLLVLAYLFESARKKE